MINLSRWNIILILGAVILAFLYSAPNVVGQGARDWAGANLPSFFPHKTVNLGLDLRGGAHLLYEVDVESMFRERAELMAQDLRTQLRDAKIMYAAISTLPQGVKVTLKNASDAEAARGIVRKMDQYINVDTGADGLTIQGVLSDKGLAQIYDQTISQSIEIVRRRIDALGTTEPMIARQGQNRILIQAPGGDATQLKNVVGTTAKLTFHLVPEGGGDAGVKVYPFDAEPGRKLAVERRAIVTGDMLETAQPAFDQFGAPVISFRFNNAGSRRFCDVTKANVNKPFAIVLDNKILSAPVIREPICGGAGQISGGFSVAEANNLALLLRAGALPAPMKVAEERTVGPTLGSDSVEAGKKACLWALVFVAAFASAAYGLFGVFASIGVVINVVMIIAVLSLLQATLTLPGIAGIVLTMGLAVDGNVLVFERIKEELRAGRGVLSAIDTGYQRAKTTITDSNLTALISALILFSFGTGPIKGFAVTTCIGVATSYFCSLMLTRLMVLMWVKWKRPKAIQA